MTGWLLDTNILSELRRTRPEPKVLTFVAAQPLVGHLHRGAEKLFEVRDYRQLLVLANRHDWLSAFSSELGVVLGPELAIYTTATALARANAVNTLVFGKINTSTNASTLKMIQASAFCPKRI